MRRNRQVRVRALDLLGRSCVRRRHDLYQEMHQLIKTHSLGAILAVAFYRFIKILEYENANPGQDHNELDEKAARRSMDKETV